MSARLTRELIQAAHPHPVADDPSVMPTASEEEIVAERAKFLEASQQSQDGLWLFAYGSLIWNPELEFADSRPAIALGWHRRFCLWQWRYRGSKDRPGLMLALDRGGSCQGLAYRVNGPEIGEKIAGVWRREMIGLGYRPRWLHLNSSAGRLRALGFVVNQNSPRYAGHLPLSVVADHIASARGARGPSAEYLLETHEACLRLGIKDDMLENLRTMVAERLSNMVQNQ